MENMKNTTSPVSVEFIQSSDLACKDDILLADHLLKTVDEKYAVLNDESVSSKEVNSSLWNIEAAPINNYSNLSPPTMLKYSKRNTVSCNQSENTFLDFKSNKEHSNVEADPNLISLTICENLSKKGDANNSESYMMLEGESTHVVAQERSLYKQYQRRNKVKNQVDASNLADASSNSDKKQVSMEIIKVPEVVDNCAVKYKRSRWRGNGKKRSFCFNSDLNNSTNTNKAIIGSFSSQVEKTSSFKTENDNNEETRSLSCSKNETEQGPPIAKGLKAASVTNQECLQDSDNLETNLGINLSHDLRESVSPIASVDLIQSSCQRKAVQCGTNITINHKKEYFSYISQTAKDVSQKVIGEQEKKLDLISLTVPSHQRRMLIVLDINGLLADINQDCRYAHRSHKRISGRPVFKRPFCDDFLQFCFERFDVGIWSSRKKYNVDSVVDYLMGDLKHKLLFCWDQSRCTDTRCKTLDNKNKPLVLKELRKLWDKEENDLPWERGHYSASNTLLVDDSPYKAICNPPHTAIFPFPYHFDDEDDNSLGPGGELRCYLEGLAMAADVQVYVRDHPFGQNAISNTHPSWKFYLEIIKRIQKS